MSLIEGAPDPQLAPQVESPCPVCGGRSQHAFTMRGYPISECRSCAHQYVAGSFDASHVACIYGDDYFFGGGGGYPDYTALAEVTIEHGRDLAQRLSRLMPAGRMLDVGAAAGFIMKGFSEEGWTGIGLEPNQRMVRYGVERLGLDLRVGTLETFEVDEPFDLINLVQVIHHFRDLHKAVSAAHRFTRQGGFCLVEYWDRHSLPARLLGKHWIAYNPPSVLHCFNRQSLALLFQGAGFTRVAEGRPKRQVMGSHAKSVAEHVFGRSPLTQPIAAIAKLIPDGAKLPYPALDVKWALFRKPV